MNALANVLAEVTFIPHSEGGRVQVPDCASAWYYPHLVVGDPGQRSAVVGPGNVLTEEYLGVGFAPGTEAFDFGVPREVRLRLIYFPRLAYEGVVPGATSTLREGSRIVG